MPFEMSPDDQAQAEESSKQIQQENEKLGMAYAHIFKSPAGKIVLDNLLLLCNAEAGVVRNKNNPDPNSVLFEAGKLAVINWIKLMIRIDDDRRERKQ